MILVEKQTAIVLALLLKGGNGNLLAILLAIEIGVPDEPACGLKLRKVLWAMGPLVFPDIKLLTVLNLILLDGACEDILFLLILTKKKLNQMYLT